MLLDVPTIGVAKSRLIGTHGEVPDARGAWTPLLDADERIGAVLRTEDEYTTVVRLVPAGPADKSDLIGPEDRITSVAQGAEGEFVDVVGWRLDDVVDLIRGPAGSVVRLEVIRDGEEASGKSEVISLTR